MNKTGRIIEGKKNLLSVYFTADYPVKDCTNEIILALQQAGADMIEIGMPFSDPLADGPVIQKSSMKAIDNGFTIESLFADLKFIQPDLNVPIVLMGYFNSILAYGVESFLMACESLAIDTVIIPDLPPEIYRKNYKSLFAQYKVSPVFLITPQTNPARMELIDSLSNAFIYVVAGNNTTGSTAAISDYQLEYFKKISETKFSVPVLIGFGIADQKSFRQACDYAHGAIIGSAFIQGLEYSDNLSGSIHHFIQSIKKETS
ncbi:MAG: tryptophan synthase subunit alpha [Saprospiraceae bacterium]